MTTLAETLAKFSQTHGASGYEDHVRALVVREFKKVVDEIEITPLGSVIGIRRARTAGNRRRNSSNSRTAPRSRNGRSPTSQSTPRVLIEAHMDEIGLLVRGIEDGFIRFDEIGHFDPRVLPSQNVIVHGRKALPGVIGARPPHVVSLKERETPIPMPDLFIDIGLDDAQARELVSAGDFITFDRTVIPLQNDLIAGKAMDDRVCLVALLEMLRGLEELEHAWDVYAVANVNEEDSAVYVGALTSTYKIQPQIAICLDVTHAQQPGLRDDAAPEMSKGPSVARGANMHPFVFEKLRAAAVQAGVPHQITVYGGDTQTNGWMMQVAGSGVATGLVEIPLRYMHTSVETIQPADVASMAEILQAFVGSLTLEDAETVRGERFVRGAGGNGRSPNGRGATGRAHSPVKRNKVTRQTTARPTRRTVTKRATARKATTRPTARRTPVKRKR